MPALVLAANGGRRGLPMALRQGVTTMTTMAHAPMRMAHAHRDDGTTRRDDEDEMRNALRARRQDETPTTTRTSELAARISGTDKSNNQLDDDSERGRGSGRKLPRQQQRGRAPTIDFGLKWPTTTKGQRRRPRSPANCASGTAPTRRTKSRRCQ
jgi:hypothetical protein